MLHNEVTNAVISTVLTNKQTHTIFIRFTTIF